MFDIEEFRVYAGDAVLHAIMKLVMHGVGMIHFRDRMVIKMWISEELFYEVCSMFDHIDYGDGSVEMYIDWNFPMYDIDFRVKHILHIGNSYRCVIGLDSGNDDIDSIIKKIYN